MRNLFHGLLGLAVIVGMTSCINHSAAARGRITELRELPILPGPNTINLFVADGRSGLVTEGWRDLGGGVGYRIYSVMVPNSNPIRGWDLVPVEPANDDPNGHEVTQISGSVRFARGWLDGAPTTFLFTARRDPAARADPTTPAKMVLDTYRLVTGRSGSNSENAFEPVSSTKSSGEFCSPDLAIAREFGLKLAPTYTGPNQSDGCPGHV